jgi:phospholipid-binding lipoprotein MlaA
MKLAYGSSFVALALLLGGCAHHPADNPADPLEPVNRVVFTINDKADKYALKPVARAYKYVVPEPARTGVTNVFDNLDEPRNIVNDLFQLKFKQSAVNLGRLLLNTVAGLGGLFDVASEVGLAPHTEDFGQTLGYWGVGEGWYLMLPLLGPSDTRDFAGFIVDMPTQFTFYLPGGQDPLRYGSQFLNVVNFRAGLLGTDRILDEQFDRYLFIRTAYLQRRQSLVYDGNPPPEEFVVPDDDEPAPAEPAKKQ